MNKIAIFLPFAVQRKSCGRILSSPVHDIYASDDDIPIIHVDSSSSSRSIDDGAESSDDESLKDATPGITVPQDIPIVDNLPKEAITNILSFLGNPAYHNLVVSWRIGAETGDIVGGITLKQSPSPNAKRQATHRTLYYKQEISSADTPLAMRKPVSGVHSWY
jgi:hypothetical protein